MCAELNRERKFCSLCKRVELESLVDLTAKRSPEAVVARETAAEEPRPMMGPLVHSIAEIEENSRAIVEYGKVLG